MDNTVKELVVIAVLAVLGLALAWRLDADYFAMFFAAAVAIAIAEAFDGQCDLGLRERHRRNIIGGDPMTNPG